MRRRRRRKRNPSGPTIVIVGGLVAVAAGVAIYFATREEMVSVATPEGVKVLPKSQVPDAGVPTLFEV